MVNPAAVKVTPGQIAAVLIEGALENNPNVPAAADLADHPSLARSTTPRLDLMNAVVEIANGHLAGVTPAEKPAGEAREFLTRAPGIVKALHAGGDDKLCKPLSALADLQIKMLRPFSAVNKWSEEHLVVIEAGFRMLNELLELNTNWCTTTFCEQLNTLAGEFLKSPALNTLLNSEKELNGAEAVHELVRATDGLCDDNILEHLARVAGLINRKCLFHLRQDEDVYDDEDEYDDDYYGESSEPASSSSDKDEEVEVAIDKALDCWDETTRRILCKLTDSTAVSAPTIGQIESIFNESLRSTLLQLEALDVIAVHAPEKLSTLLHNMLQKMGDDHAQVSPYYTLRALLRLGIIQQRYQGNTKLKDPTDIIVDEICRYCTRFSTTKKEQMEAFNAVFRPTRLIFLDLVQTPTNPDAPFREQLMKKFRAIYNRAEKNLNSSPQNKNPRGS